jgi:membrane-associated protein
VIELIEQFFRTIYNVPELIRLVGMAGLVVIVFAETGLMVGFFLPGDSLLVTAGIFAVRGDLDIVWLNVLLSAAAILGDATGYWIGRRAGQALYSRPDSFLFRRSHLLRTKAFYEKHGGKTIVIARFMPIARTFAPVVAGAAEMTYKRFASYNVFGGILWVREHDAHRLLPRADRRH